MPSYTTATDLMRTRFLRLGAEHSLREVLGLLFAPQGRRNDDPLAIVVVSRRGDTLGLLTARHLLRALLPEWLEDHDLEESDELEFEQRLMPVLHDRLDQTITDAMQTDVPEAAPDDRLPVLIDYMNDKRLDCIPVVDGGRIVGVVHLVDVFGAAARLALAAHTASNEPKG
jgi:CBS domain-containing protein